MFSSVHQVNCLIYLGKFFVCVSFKIKGNNLLRALIN